MSERETIQLMEVCGTHTMAIAKAGIRSVMPPHVRLISGPGCPVCVTPPESIDAVLELANRPGITIATYGDMVRVPGSVKGENLRKHSALGADVRVVYSAMDAVALAAEHPEREIVFLGVGFETSAPGTVAALEAALERDLKNFSVFSLLKRTEPAIRALAEDPDFRVQGFLCPGHVAAIIGEAGLRFIPEELKIPAVISGFEPNEIMRAIHRLLLQIREGEPRMENEYRAVVRPEGNLLALDSMEKYLEPAADTWRGLGRIENSGLKLREAYRDFDAEKRFGIRVEPVPVRSACRCGDVIRGKLDPTECPLFGTACLPEDPEGPCMVSSEGACAAAYKYRMFD